MFLTRRFVVRLLDTATLDPAVEPTSRFCHPHVRPRHHTRTRSLRHARARLLVCVCGVLVRVGGAHPTNLSARSYVCRMHLAQPKPPAGCRGCFRPGGRCRPMLSLCLAAPKAAQAMRDWKPDKAKHASMVRQARVMCGLCAARALVAPFHTIGCAPCVLCGGVADGDGCVDREPTGPHPCCQREVCLRLLVSGAEGKGVGRAWIAWLAYECLTYAPTHVECGLLVRSWLELLQGPGTMPVDPLATPRHRTPPHALLGPSHVVGARRGFRAAFAPAAGGGVDHQRERRCHHHHGAQPPAGACAACCVPASCGTVCASSARCANMPVVCVCG